MGRFEDERIEMIELIKSRGVKDSNVLNAMLKIERHKFVPEAFKNRSYDDQALPIAMQQTISQPYTVAFMTECLDAKPNMKVLEIGTGSGYQAAILAEMGCRVFTIERHMDLLVQARKLLEELGYHIASKCGDGSIGWTEFAPYDRIIVTAAAPEPPQPILDQLEEGGKLVIPVGNLDVQTMQVITKIEGKYKIKETYGFKFVPLIGKKGWKNDMG